MTLTDFADIADDRRKRAVRRIMTQPTVNVDDAAVAAGVSRSAVYEAVRSGQWPSIRAMSRIRIPTKWLRDQLMLGGE